MNLTEDSLQEIVEQLEAGQPVETSIADLTADDAEVVRLIAAMRQVRLPDEDEASVTAREATLLAAAKEQFPSDAPAASATRSRLVTFLLGLKAWLGTLPRQRQAGLGFAFALLLIAAVWFGWSLGNNADDSVADVRPADVGGDDNAPAVDDTSSEIPTDVVDEGDEETAIAALPADSASVVYVPFLSLSVQIDAATAVVEDVQGYVELQDGPGSWSVVGGASAMTAGQRLRTGKLSQATLTFYDGSQAFLGANSEISIDELNALRPEEGFRNVVLTQHVGESRHSVRFRNDAGSRYEVRTPAGSGIARGTIFDVLVTPDSLARYLVIEGKVDVTGQSRTVSVTAGQLTTLMTGSVPEQPVFTIHGEGEVEATGADWTIAGQTFQTHAQTLIVGNPQIGDLVRVEGHLLADGGRVADRIILLRRAIENRFTLIGEVEAIGVEWTIAGQAVIVDDQTDVDEAIAVGDTVQAEGIILPSGRLQAHRIILEEEAPGLPFWFSGVVQSIDDELWIISSQSIAVDDETAIDDGIETGDVVAVSGWIQESDTWLASEIRRQRDDLPSFEFTGVVQGMDPWQVAGISFETRPWTDVSPGVAVGDRVRVRGSILSDGTRVAASITAITDSLADTVIFVGRVASIDPWIVNGLQLHVTPDTQIVGDISVSTVVVVRAQLLPDGTWSVLSVRPLFPAFGHGCLIFSSPVVAVDASVIRLKHWKVDIKRDGRIKIHGDIKLNSIVTVPLCFRWDGNLIIIGDIIVIYQPIVVIIDDGGGLPDGCRISGRGSIKCSRRSDR